uniref:hypothetical protein n=1 Tax=uncultured Erythrobacter sp. TaxID=263913 RepID=UPI0026299EF6|nr:hypothetical protein [uncultured Erythrobacter sp.]
MISASSNISAVIARIKPRIARSADMRGKARETSLHSWRSSATLWPTFGED